MFPTQLLSSWGACSATGKPEENKEVFFNDNFEMLKKNFASGNGEYLKTFMSFFQCSEQGESEFVKIVRMNYDAIFIHPQDSSNLNLNPAESSFSSLQIKIQSDKIIINECKKLF